MNRSDGHAQRLLRLPLFAALGEIERDELMRHCRMDHALAGENLIVEGDVLKDYLVLLTGELEVSRIGVDENGREAVRLGRLRSGQGAGKVALLYPGPRVATVRAKSDADFIRIDSDVVDELLTASEQFADSAYAEGRARARMNVARSAKSLRNLPLHAFTAVYERFESRSVKSGEVIVRQGEKGDNYYLIEAGRAAVWRTDPISDEIALVAELGSGEAFGEEAVILDGFRNATVKMVTDGVLLVLDRQTFESVIRSSHVTELDPEEARSRVEAGQAQWLDCRYEMEYEEARIAGAKLVELHRMRDACPDLDKNQTYIVYCRSGRRSACAAFLLRERRIDAVSLKGGLRDWPFAVEGDIDH